MKSRSLLWLVLLALPLLAGCTRTYVISLTNGSRITCAGKPKLANGIYTYKDVRGEKFTVSEMRVREVAPASMAEDEFSTGDHRGFLPK